MLLVFFIILVLILLIISLRIEIEIENFRYIKKHISNNVKVKIRLYTLNKLRFLKIKLDKKKLEKLFSNKRLSKVNIKKIKSKVIDDKKEYFKLLKALEIKKLELLLLIGTEDVMITTFLIPLLSAILSNLLIKVGNNENCKYKIEPKYDGNSINIDLNCIISIKLVHIIGIMWKKIKNGDGKNERTSNRRTYAYGND